MQIVLLTHEREVDRPSNTGQLALDLVPHLCRRVLWSRVKPDLELVTKLARKEAKLLFPKPKCDIIEQELAHHLEAKNGPVLEPMHDISKARYQALNAKTIPQVLVILDATWQEARKMYRQSPYLKQASTCYLEQKSQSNYQLRRNQLEGGLCTIECIITIEHLLGHHDTADLLMSAYRQHNST